MKIIKFETNSLIREKAVNWWNTLTDENRKEFVKEYSISVVTGQAVQQVYQDIMSEPVIEERIYTKAEVLELFDIFKMEYCSELNQDVYNQFLTNKL